MKKRSTSRSALVCVSALALLAACCADRLYEEPDFDEAGPKQFVTPEPDNASSGVVDGAAAPDAGASADGGDLAQPVGGVGPDGSEKLPFERLVLSEDEWRERLTSDQFHILREKGTERAGTGALLESKTEGTYTCAGCGLDLFASSTKFESGTGWPSFYQPIGNANVAELIDRSHGWVRTEVLCGRCDGHLGHVFPDGPLPTGLRYCINSASLALEPVD